MLDERPGVLVHHEGMPQLIVWVGTIEEYQAVGGRIHETLFCEGYYVTVWRHATNPTQTVTAVGLINRAGFDSEQERDAVCRHIMAIVEKAKAGDPVTPGGPPPGTPPELKRLVAGKGWAKYTVLVACGDRVAAAEFLQNEHGWFCDRIGREMRWEYPIPDGGPQRDGTQAPSPSPREAALTLLRMKGCGDLYFKILLDEFPPMLSRVPTQ